MKNISFVYVNENPNEKPFRFNKKPNEKTFGLHRH